MMPNWLLASLYALACTPVHAFVTRNDNEASLTFLGRGAATTEARGMPQQGNQIAFMTVMTKDPKQGKLAKLDGAGVLAESILKHMGHLHYDLVAVVTPEVQTSRPILRKFGYKVVERPVPDVSLITNPEFAEELQNDGCCGAGEMLKLEAYRMVAYDRVFVMDTDTLVHGSFEELLDRKEVTLYTAPYAKQENEHLQGSFLVVKPNQKWYDEIMGIWHAGDYGDNGWNNSGIGGNYGGRTIQGILPYFLKIVHPEESAEIDHCVWNNNGDERAERHYCEGRDVKEAKMNHFTVCQKPWYCLYPDEGAFCRSFIDEWWKTRNSLSKKLGGKGTRHPCQKYTDGMSDAYTPILASEGPVTDGW